MRSFLKLRLDITSTTTDLLLGLLSDVIPQASIISITEPGDNLSGWHQICYAAMQLSRYSQANATANIGLPSREQRL